MTDTLLPKNDASTLRDCRKCKAPKPLSEYGKDAWRKDGIAPECKPCTNAKNRRLYRKNWESKNKQNAEYRTENWDKIRVQARARQDTFYKDADIARKNLRAAVGRGLITKGLCEVCDEAKVDFHHTNGYDKPNWFVGKWLCRTHHAAEHVRLRELKRELQHAN